INARAITDCRLAALSRNDTINILEKMPKIAFNFINTLCSRLVEAEHYMDGLLFKSIEERITDQLYKLSKGHGVYLKDGVLVNLQITHQFLADMIGISRESVTRGIKELKREGVIKYMKNRHYVLDASPFKSI
ncbi:MAG: Crp/Fnr family transcriptional regulator, partial [Nitrospirae bacterium]|nr:Crp/Fnr family transcriptional regulator [Nitrospirota bacterium]